MIELELLAWMSALYGGIAVPTVFTMARVKGWLGRRRNRKALCARCSSPLLEGGAEAFRIMGVLHCEACSAGVRRDFTTSLWLVAGLTLFLPLVGLLGIAGLLPFVSGGLSVGSIAGLLLPPVIVGGALRFEMGQMKKANAAAELEDGEAAAYLGSVEKA